MDFKEWISKKLSKNKKKGRTYRERVLSGEQKSFRQKPGKGLRKVSKKRKKEHLEYSKVSKKFLIENPECEICGQREHLSVHHKKGRGKYLCDTEHFMVACVVGNYLDAVYPESNHFHTGGCHGWIEANKEKARELGYITY